MKKRALLPALLAVVLLTGAAALAGSGDDGARAALEASGIQPVLLTRWGDTAACLAGTDSMKRLILLERTGGDWRIVIDNPTALLRDLDWPQLLLDSDSAVFWTYTLSDTETVRYHSARGADGAWGPVDEYYADSGFGGYTHTWSTAWDGSDGGEIVRVFSVEDAEGNDSGIQSTQFLPASWMGDCVRLADFDVSRFPTLFSWGSDAYASGNERFFREAAAALMPGRTFVGGLLKDDAMHFLMEKGDGTRVYAVCDYTGHPEVNLIESAPLPAGTVLGVENFTDSLWIDGRCVTVRLLDNGTAGIEYIYDDGAYPEGFLFFGSRTVWQDLWQETVLYGDHPWDDITDIDWSSLPHGLDEAAAGMDAEAFAFVHNPDPKDRLHLRERADRKSASLGKYYNGTPVTVLREQGDWAEVTVGGRHGWMMKKYLDTGDMYPEALCLNTLHMPQFSARDEVLRVYAEPRDGTYVPHRNADGTTMKVIGVIGDEWCHVWFPAAGEYGYVRREDLWEGNG